MRKMANTLPRLDDPVRVVIAKSLLPLFNQDVNHGQTVAVGVVRVIFVWRSLVLDPVEIGQPVPKAQGPLGARPVT